MNNTVKLSSGLEYEQTATQKLWLNWQYMVKYFGKHSYAGTVPEAVIAKRRARSKMAKKSRKANR